MSAGGRESPPGKRKPGQHTSPGSPHIDREVSPDVSQGADNGKRHTPIVRTDDRHSVHFDGDERAPRDAARSIGCPFQLRTHARRLSVPLEFGDAIGSAGITDRSELW